VFRFCSLGFGLRVPCRNGLDRSGRGPPPPSSTRSYRRGVAQEGRQCSDSAATHTSRLCVVLILAAAAPGRAPNRLRLGQLGEGGRRRAEWVAPVCSLGGGGTSPLAATRLLRSRAAPATRRRRRPIRTVMLAHRRQTNAHSRACRRCLTAASTPPPPLPPSARCATPLHTRRPSSGFVSGNQSAQTNANGPVRLARSLSHLIPTRAASNITDDNNSHLTQTNRRSDRNAHRPARPQTTPPRPTREPCQFHHRELPGATMD
jgi:hypothetical protein